MTAGAGAATVTPAVLVALAVAPLARPAAAAADRVADAVDADPLTFAAAAFTDAPEAEAVAHRVVRIGPEHGADLVLGVLPELRLRRPRARRSGLRRTGTEDSDEAAVRGKIELLAPREPRLIVRALERHVALRRNGLRRPRLTALALVRLAALAATARGIVRGDLLLLQQLLLALGRRVQHRLHLEHLLAADPFGIVRVHARHEHRERCDDRRVARERETDERRRARSERSEEADRDLLARAHRRDLDRDGVELDRDAHALAQRDLLTAVRRARMHALRAHRRARALRNDRVARARAALDDRRAHGFGQDEVAALADREALSRLEVREQEHLRSPAHAHLDCIEMRLDLLRRHRGSALDEGVGRLARIRHVLDLHERVVRSAEGVVGAERIGERVGGHGWSWRRAAGTTPPGRAVGRVGGCRRCARASFSACQRRLRRRDRAPPKRFPRGGRHPFG